MNIWLGLSYLVIVSQWFQSNPYNIFSTYGNELLEAIDPAFLQLSTLPVQLCKLLKAVQASLRLTSQV